MLPQDPFILLSYVNAKLRDEYDSLDALCDSLETDSATLIQTLAGAGYTYHRATNQFKPL